MEEEAGSQQPRHAALDDPEFAKYWRGPASGEGAGLALLTVSVALPQDTDMHCAGCLEWAFVGRARLAQQGERLSVPALAAPPLGSNLLASIEANLFLARVRGLASNAVGPKPSALATAPPLPPPAAA